MADAEIIKMYADAVAARLGIPVGSFYGYYRAAPGRTQLFPGPDGYDVDRGHARPFWYPETVERGIAARPGPGARTDLRRALPPT